MTTKTIKTILFASLFAVMLLPFIGMNDAHAQELTMKELELKVQQVLDTKDTAEELGQKMAKIEQRLEKAIENKASDTTIARLQNNLDAVTEEFNNTMAKFVELTTDENNQIDTEILAYASQGGVGISTRSVSNYNTEFWSSPQCGHVATFANPCSGADYTSSEFAWETPKNALTTYSCSAGTCVSAKWELNAPGTWTYTPVTLFFDKKQTYGIDFVTGQTTNTLTLYGADSTHWWNYTPVNHHALNWAINYYENPSGSETKTIWTSSVVQYGFNAS